MNSGYQITKTDVLQTVAGAVITVVGLGLTPFTGGLSLGLVALGGISLGKNLDVIFSDTELGKKIIETTKSFWVHS